MEFSITSEVFECKENYFIILLATKYKIQGWFQQKKVEDFSKTTAAKEKDQTSVKFHDKTTNSQKFRTKLQTALPNSLDHAS